MRAAGTLRFYKNINSNWFRNGLWSMRNVRHITAEGKVDNAIQAKREKKLANGPGLKEFLIAGKNLPAHSTAITTETVPYLNDLDFHGFGRKVFFDVYGCQMNVNDTEIVWAILKENGYVKAQVIEEANIVLVVTCAIREKAEDKVHMIAIFSALSSKYLITLLFDFRYGID